MSLVEQQTIDRVTRHMRVRDGKALAFAIDPVKERILEARLKAHANAHRKLATEMQGLNVSAELLASSVVGGSTVLIIGRANPDHVLAVSSLIRGLNLITKALQKTRDVVETSWGSLSGNIGRFNVRYFCSRFTAENLEKISVLESELAAVKPNLVIALDPVRDLIPKLKAGPGSPQIVSLTTYNPIKAIVDSLVVHPESETNDRVSAKEFTITSVAQELVVQCRDRLVTKLSEHARTQVLTAQLKTAGLEANETFVALSYLCDDMPMETHVRKIVGCGVVRVSRGWSQQPRTSHSQGMLCYGLRALLEESEASYPFTAQQLQIRLIPFFSSVCFAGSPETLIECLMADRVRTASEKASRASFLKAKTYVPSLKQLGGLIGAEPQTSEIVERSKESLMGYEEREFENDSRLFPIYAERCYAESGKTQLVWADLGNGLIRCFLRSDHINVNDALRYIGYEIGEEFLPFQFWADAFSGDFVMEIRAFDEFKLKLNQYLHRYVSQINIPVSAIIDGPLTGSQRVPALAQWLEKQAWGRLFPEPIFEQAFSVHSSTLIMDTHQKLLVDDYEKNIGSGMEPFEILWRNSVMSSPAKLSAGQKIIVKYRLRSSQDSSCAEVYGDVLDLTVMDGGDLL